MDNRLMAPWGSFICLVTRLDWKVMFSDRRVVELVLPPVCGVFCCAVCVCALFWPDCPGVCAGCVAAGGGDCAPAGCCGARLDAVPGDVGGEMRVTPLVSSVFCEVSITDLAGSNVSSLCSPLVMSMSA